MTYDREALLARRIVAVDGVLDDDFATEIIAKLLFLVDRAPSEIKLLVDSPGGSVVALLAVLDAVEELRCPVATHGANAQGTAVALVSAGRTSRRTVDPNGLFSLLPLTVPQTRAPSLRIDRVRAELTRRLVDASRLTAVEVEQALSTGHLYTAAVLVRLGLADALCGTHERIKAWARSDSREAG